MAGHFFISADLGQANDYTAITIVERPYTKLGADERPYYLRHIERPERGTPYPVIVERLRELSHSEQLKGVSKTVVIDCTGVGAPVWDMMRRVGLKGSLNGILITGGSSVALDGDIYHVPKRDLVMSLLVALQNGQLRIARGLPLADVLIKELLNFKVRISASGHDQYEAWRESVHDDIVLSAAMAVWLASQQPRYAYTMNRDKVLAAARTTSYPDYFTVP